MKPHRLFLLSAAVALTACGDTSTPVSDTADSCSPGGIWRAPDGTVAIIDETPRGHIVRPDGTQFVGDLVGFTVNDRDCFLDKEKSELHAAIPLSAALPDGSVAANGRAFGEWIKRSGSLQLTADLRTTADNKYALSFAGLYDPLHASGASKEKIAGSYQATVSPESEVLTIDATGRMFSQNAVTGCVADGDISPSDDRFNVYRVNLRYSSCQGALAVLNGLPVKGLAIYDDTVTAARLHMALDVIGSTRHYSVVLTEQRM